jgi:hypothetical protein
MTPQGSSWPAVDDTARTINEGTTAFTANLPNEIAEMVETLQQHLGINPADFSAELGITAFADVGAALLALCRFEIGSYSHAGSTIAQAVSFAHPGRFTSAPLVFLQPAFAAMPDHNENYGVTSRATTGFTSLRRVTGYAASSSARTIFYLAIQLP